MQNAMRPVMLGRVSLAAVLVAGLSGAALARGADARERTGGPHGIGFNAPKFGSDIRTGKDQPYTWPVGDRYRPVSKPFYGRAY